MFGWLKATDRINALEQELAALRASIADVREERAAVETERARAAAQIEAERARGGAALDQLAERLTSLHERALAETARGRRIEETLSGLDEQADRLSDLRGAVQGADERLRRIEEEQLQGLHHRLDGASEEIGRLQSSLRALEHGMQGSRAQVEDLMRELLRTMARPRDLEMEARRTAS